MRLGLTFAERRGGFVECAAPYPNAASDSTTISVTTAARSFGTSSLTTASMSVMAFYEKVIKVKADVAAFLINCFPFA